MNAAGMLKKACKFNHSDTTPRYKVITEEDGTVQTFEKDDVFFVPKGTVCSWKASGYVKKYYAMLS